MYSLLESQLAAFSVMATRETMGDRRDVVMPRPITSKMSISRRRVKAAE